MKLEAIIISLIVAIAWAQEKDNIAQKWRNFQVVFSKTYKSPVEARHRLNIFKDNLLKIETHNSRFQRGEVSFTMGINKFADWTSAEFHEYINKGRIIRTKSTGQIFNKTEISSLVESVDWRTKNVVTPVKDQGQCGSCWAFSTTGSIEGQLGIVRGTLISLSEQNLVDCSQAEGNMGCSGGLETYGFEYVKRYGIESEREYPYEGVDDTCKANTSKVVTKISKYIDLPVGDEQSLQEAIALVGPISLGMAASSNLQLYSSGILDDDLCDFMENNHGVLAVGYGTENGRQYYIIKNSWGASWGESGYFRLPRNDNGKCGITKEANYPVL